LSCGRLYLPFASAVDFNNELTRIMKMPTSRLILPVAIALTACAANLTTTSRALADDSQENQALKEQMRQMMQRMDALQKQVEALTKQQPATPPVATMPTPPQQALPGPDVAVRAPEKKFEEKEPLLHQILSGFYGTLDVSFDDVTKGIRGITAYSYSYAGAGPGTGYVNNGPKGTQLRLHHGQHRR
jgi:uncharacterized coiled-coil protein SlyX